jgi:hypothetical protein
LSRAWARLLDAGLHQLDDRVEHACSALEKAAESLDALDTRLYAHAARRRLGQLRGGEDGTRAIAEADLFLIRQGIRNPARLCQYLVPGWPLDDEQTAVSPANTP